MVVEVDNVENVENVENIDRLIREALALEPSDARLPELAWRIREHAERDQNLLQLTQAQLLLGRHYFAHSQYLAAVDALEAGLAQRHLLPYQAQCQFLICLGKSYFVLNRFDALIAQSAELLKLAADTGSGADIKDPNYEIEVHSLLGSLNVVLGILDTALSHFDRGIEIANQASIPLSAHLLYGLGRFYYTKEDNVNALYYFEDALRQARIERNSALEGAILNNIGIFYSNERQYAEATQRFLLALNASRKANDAWTMMLQCNNLGVDLMDRKRFCSARRYFRLALKYLEKTPSNSREALIKGNLGELAQLTGDLDTARQLLHESLALAEQSRDSRRIQERYEDLSTFYEQTGDLANALKYYKRFHQQKILFIESSASVRGAMLQNKFELERLRQEQEIHRLKNIELSAAVQQLEQLSQRDGLTGLYNRRYFDDCLRRLSDEHQQRQHALCIMLADIDDFKRINDTFSHVIGDEVLKVVGNVFINSLRASDVVARYGGEEIAVLFPETTLSNALWVCERIRAKIESYPWETLATGLRVTISVGLVDNLTHAEAQMLAAADAKLYAAKRKGKNCIES